MAGASAAVSDTVLVVLSGDDGSLYTQADTLRDHHPGFPREAYFYDSQADRWQPGQSIPTAQLTTPAVRWQNRILLVSGELRPRVRTQASWQITW